MVHSVNPPLTFCISYQLYSGNPPPLANESKDKWLINNIIKDTFIVDPLSQPDKDILRYGIVVFQGFVGNYSSAHLFAVSVP